MNANNENNVNNVATNKIDYNKYPSVIEICMENAVCNMKCKYCFGGFIDNHNCHTGKIPPFDESILDLRLSNVAPDYRGIIKIWGGEPLANWDTFVKVARYIRSKFQLAQLVLITNGSLLNDDKAEFLIENRFMVNMSHDGSGQSLRGKDPLEDEKVLSAINYLKLNNCFSSFHTVIHNKSDSLEDQVKYWSNVQKKLRFPVVVSWSIFRITDDWTNEFVPDMDKHNKFIDYTFQTMIDASMGRSKKVTFQFSTDQDRALRSILFNEYSEYPCSTFDSLTVGLSGDLYRCVQDAERRSGVQDPNLMKKESYKLLPECETCEALHECSGMCVVLTDEQRRKNCNNYKNFIKYMKDYIHEDFNRARAIARYLGVDLRLSEPKLDESKDIVSEDELNNSTELEVNPDEINVHTGD